MAGAENEEVAFVLKVLDQEKTQAALEKARASAKGMTEEQKATTLAAADAAKRQVEAHTTWQTHIEGTKRRQNELRAAIFQTIEIANRVIGMVRALGQAVDEIAQRNFELAGRMNEARLASENLADSFSQGIADGGNFATAVSQITGEINSMGVAARTAGQAVDWVVGLWNRGRSGPGWTAALGGGALTWAANVAMSGDDPAAAARAAEQAGFGAWSATQRNQADERRRAELDAEAAGWLDVNAGMSEGRSGGGNRYNSPTGPRRRGGGGGGGAGAAPRYDEYGPSMEEFLEAIAREGEAWAELNRQRREGEDEVAAARMSAAEDQAQAIQDEKALEEEAHRLRLEWAAEEKAQQQQIRDYTREQVIGSVQAFASMAQVGSGIFTQLAAQQEQQINNITSVLQASGASQAAIERATSAQQDRLDRLKKVEGGFLIAYNAVMGATATADSIRAFTKLDIAAGLGHAAAAAGYFAAAAMAGIRLGDDGSGGGGSAAPTIATPSYSTRAAETGPGENTSTNLTIFTWGYSNSGLGRQVERARFEYERSGGDADMLAGASGYGE